MKFLNRVAEAIFRTSHLVGIMFAIWPIHSIQAQQTRQLNGNDVSVALGYTNQAALLSAITGALQTNAAASTYATLTDARLVPVGTAAPTTGAHNLGDVVRNTDPTELGSTGSKYLTFAFLCIGAGTPGTWVPLNIFDGN